MLSSIVTHETCPPSIIPEEPLPTNPDSINACISDISSSNPKYQKEASSSPSSPTFPIESIPCLTDSNSINNASKHIDGPGLPSQPPDDTHSEEKDTNAEGKKRKRVSRACDICWKKKVRCDNDSKEICDNCQINGFNCTYVRDAKRRGPKSSNPFTIPSTPLPMTETKLDDLSNSPQWHLLDLYFKYIYPCNPILPKHIFLEHVWSESPFLLNSMYAFASKFLPSEVERKDTAPSCTVSAGFDFYKISRTLLDSIIDIPCLSSIWGLYLLGKYAACIGQGVTSRFFYNSMIWMAKEMKLYKPSEFKIRSQSNLSLDAELEYRNRLWWTCVLVDIELSCCNHSSLNLLKISQTPCPYSDSLFDYPMQRMGFEQELQQIKFMSIPGMMYHPLPLSGVHSFVIVLYKFYQEIHLFQSVNGMRRDSSNQMIYLRFDASLKSYFDSLPDELKFLPPDSFNSNDPSLIPWPKIYLHLIYQSCIAYLHRGILCNLAVQTPAALEVSLKDPSVIACLCACRSVTSILNESLNVTMSFFPEFLGQIILQIGLIHSEVCRLLPNTRLFMQHTLFGQVHIDALNDMSAYYYSCSIAMQSFIKSNQTIVMTLQKSSNPTFPSMSSSAY